MSLKFEFPDTGEGVTEGQFLEWLVEEGEQVEEDQTVAEVETDKAVVDIPAPADGTIEELRAEPGDTVEVGEVIMTMSTGEKEDSDERPEQNEGGAREKNIEETQERDEKNVETDSSEAGDVLALPKVRMLAREKSVDLGEIQGSGPEGRVVEEDVKTAAGAETQRKFEHRPEAEEEPVEESEAEANVDANASPSVRRLAREKGVNLENVEGSGRGGKITREDVLEAAGTGSGSTQDAAGERSREAREERIEMSPVRKTIAEKMEESKFTIPHVTHVEKADVTRLKKLRQEKKDEVESHLTYLPFIMKAALIGLEDYPDLNAELDEDSDEIVRKNYYSFNIAVDTEAGLMTPLIQDIDQKSIVGLAAEIEEKAERARERDLSREELQPGSFSITNVGVIGGEEFTPIIEYPQVAILGIGRISETAEVVEGEVEPRTTVKLSLSYDHRVIDGATAARFMNTVVENLENPGQMLIEL